MPVFGQISREAAQSGLKFLIIGAHAVMQHGFMRATADVDILVNRDERPRWEELVRRLGYSIFHDGGTFLQLTPPSGIGWELDVMFVGRETFETMLREAVPATIEGVETAIPSLNHLLALKIHALKHGRGLRRLKDMEDVLQLVLANGIDVRADSFRQLVEKNGDKDLYERIVRASTE